MTTVAGLPAPGGRASSAVHGGAQGVGRAARRAGEVLLDHVHRVTPSGVLTGTL